MTRCEKAQEYIEDAIWYISRWTDESEGRTKILNGLEQVSDTLDDCLDEVCFRCGVDRHATPEQCNGCCWR